MPRDTLIDYFNDLARAKGTFLVFDDGFRARSHSYAEVGRAARGFASRLVEAGVRKGDKVVFWSENRASVLPQGPGEILCVQATMFTGEAIAVPPIRTRCCSQVQRLRCTSWFRQAAT